jgi:hypothetical protein
MWMHRMRVSALLVFMSRLASACSAYEWIPGSSDPPLENGDAGASMSQARNGAAASAACPDGFRCTQVITGETVCVKEGETAAPSCISQESCAMTLAKGMCETGFGMMFCVQRCTP